MGTKVPDKISERMCLMFSAEYDRAKQNRQDLNNDFETYVDLLDQKRTEKDYDWMSDIKIPEFVSQELTQSSMDAALNFKSRDFAEVYIEDASEEAKLAADAAKTLINRTLNRRDLHYYQKRIRAGILTRLSGEAHAECRWNKKIRQVLQGFRQVEDEIDIFGNPIADRNLQIPSLKTVPVMKDVVESDQFEIEVLDNRNVFYDNSYSYSLQDKPAVIVRSEKSLERLKSEAEESGYFNMDKLEDLEAPEQTETSQETYNKYQNQAPQDKPSVKVFDILKRYGKAWVIVKEANPENETLPIEVEPGIDEEGKIKKNAEYHEVIQEYAVSGEQMVLIAFHPTPYIDCNGKPYRPIIRSLCYIHPTEDGGFGDAKHAHDLQVGLDDTVNMGNDRTKLATIPLFKVKRFAYEENSEQFYVEPGHNIPVNEIDDLQEFKITDNIQGSMQQAAFFTDKMQQLTATYPTTMGRLPVAASTTATAVADSGQKSDTRANFKAMTWTYTWDADLYWMIMQMTLRFAEPETGLKLMGQKVENFHPELDYFYKPVTAAIESEQSKQMKFRNLQGFMQSLTPWLQFYANQPGLMMFANEVLKESAACLDKDIERIAGMLLNPKIPPMQPQQGMGAQQVSLPSMGPGAASNQSGIPQGMTQQGAREMAGGMF